jgi:hypothetical protein
MPIFRMSAKYLFIDSLLVMVAAMEVIMVTHANYLVFDYSFYSRKKVKVNIKYIN